MQPSANQGVAERCGTIDALKGAAILGVILVHSFSDTRLAESFAWFHVWQAAPIFGVLLGVTGYRTRIVPIRSYYRRRARRFLPALAVTWLVALIAGLYTGTLSWNRWILGGRMPIEGPGNYFLTLTIQFVLILPLIRYGWRKSPIGSVLLALILSAGFEIVAYSTQMSEYGYSSSVLRYAFAIALGFWIADGRSTLPLLPLSLLYLTAHARGFLVPFFVPTWQPQNLLAFGYAACIVELTVRTIRTNVPVLSRLGRASYHILLFQMLWFAYGIPFHLQTSHAAAVASIGACCLAGVAFHEADNRLFG